MKNTFWMPWILLAALALFGCDGDTTTSVADCTQNPQHEQCVDNTPTPDAPVPQDADGDGIPDAEDECPNHASQDCEVSIDPTATVATEEARIDLHAEVLSTKSQASLLECVKLIEWRLFKDGALFDESKFGATSSFRTSGVCGRFSVFMSVSAADGCTIRNGTLPTTYSEEIKDIVIPTSLCSSES